MNHTWLNQYARVISETRDYAHTLSFAQKYYKAGMEGNDPYLIFESQCGVTHRVHYIPRSY